MAIAWNTIQNTFTGPVDLNQLGTTIDYLDQQHKSVLEQSNKLLETFQNMNLNDKEFQEGGIVPQYIQKFDSIMNDYTMNGDVNDAYNNLMKLTRTMLSSPDLIGRIRANNSYEEFKKNVNDMKNLPQAYKNMYLEENQYYYNDGPVDGQGKATFGDPWEPISNPVDHIGFDSVMEKALKFIAPTTGTIQGGAFLNAQGRPVREIGKARDSKVYRQNIDGEWDAVSSDDVLDAVLMLIESDPNIKASLEQDYKYEIYDYNKKVDKLRQDGDNQNIVIPGLTDINGNLVNNYNAWLLYKIDPLTDLAAYCNVKIHYNSSGKSAATTVSQSKSNGTTLTELPPGTIRLQDGSVKTPDGKKYIQDDKGKWNLIPSSASDSIKGPMSNYEIKIPKKKIFGGRNKATLGTEDDDNDMIDDEMIDDDIIENNNVTQLPISIGREQLPDVAKDYMNSILRVDDSGGWDTQIGITNQGVVEVKKNEMQRNLLAKQQASDEIMTIIEEYNPELAKQHFDMTSLSKFYEDQNKNLNDLYNDMYDVILPTGYENDTDSDRVIHRIQAASILNDALETYKYVDGNITALKEKVGGDDVERGILESIRGFDPKRTYSRLDRLNFSQNISEGIFTNDNDGGKEMIRRLNLMFPENQNIKITVGSEVAKYMFHNMFDDTDFETQGINATRNSDFSYSIEITNANKNILPKLAYQLYLADEACSGTWFNGIAKAARSTHVDPNCYGVELSSQLNTEVLGMLDPRLIRYNRRGGGPVHAANRQMIDLLGRCYGQFAEEATQAEKEYGITSCGYLENYASGCQCEGQFIARAMLTGIPNSNERAAMSDRIDYFWNMVDGADFTNCYMEVRNEAGLSSKVIDCAEYNDLIKKARLFENGKYITSQFYPLFAHTNYDGTSNLEKGYGFQIILPKGASDKYPKLKDYEDKIITIYVQGAFDEGYNSQLGADPITRTDAQYNMSKITPDRSIPNLGYERGLGFNTEFDIKDNKFHGHLFGEDLYMDTKHAMDLSTELFKWQSFKQWYNSGFYNNEQLNTNFDYLVNRMMDVLANIKNDTSLDIDDIAGYLDRYLKFESHYHRKDRSWQEIKAEQEKLRSEMSDTIPGDSIPTTE